MTDDLNTKNGIPFDAATEYLYRKKIDELRADLALAVEALELIKSDNWICGECTVDPYKGKSVEQVIDLSLAKLKEMSG